MKYIFPRQFGLHNVFTSDVNARETSQPFKDYTLREEEINQAERRILARGDGKKTVVMNGQGHIPKRLRGPAMVLVKKLQIRHSRCSYEKLLRYYCPIKVSRCPREQTINRYFTNLAQDQYAQKHTLRTPQNHGANCSRIGTHVAKPSTSNYPTSKEDKHIPKPSEISFTKFAAPHSEVSSFCRAVLSQVIPAEFWGDGMDGLKNKSLIMKRIDQFVHLRKFETLSLHNIFQGIKVL